MAVDPDMRPAGGAEERWRRALERQPELRKLIETPTRSRSDVEAAAHRLGLHISTLYRLLRRFASDQTAEAITGEARGWRPGRSRLPAPIDSVIDAAVQDFFLTKQAPTAAALHREIGLRCRDAGLTTPAPSTIRRRLRKLGRKTVAGRREGRGAAEAQTMRPGAYQVDRPNAVWQIDHSPADVVIVDVETRTPIGRPWITFAIDVASRVVVGLHVSLEAPSVISVGLALRHAIPDKADALTERDGAADWPAFGLPDGVHNDNGSDFRSATLSAERLLEGAGCVPVFGRPSFARVRSGFGQRGQEARIDKGPRYQLGVVGPKSHCPRLRHAVRGRGLWSVRGSALPGRGQDLPSRERRREGRRPKAGRRRWQHWLMACHVRRPTRRGDPLQSFERPPQSSGFVATALSAGSTRVPSGQVPRDGAVRGAARCGPAWAFKSQL